MDAIDKIFSSAALEDESLSAPICTALAVGKKTLNCYYSLTDGSHVYHIAISASPLSLK